MAEQQVFARLNAITELGGRVYPLVLPQTVQYPAATFQRISAERQPQFGRDAMPVEATIQVDLYERRSVGYGELQTLADLVRAAFQRVDSPASTPPIYDVFVEAERDEYESDTDLLRKSFDFRIWYGES